MFGPPSFFEGGGESSNDFSRPVSQPSKRGLTNAITANPCLGGPYEDVNFPKVAANFWTHALCEKKGIDYLDISNIWNEIK